MDTLRASLILLLLITNHALGDDASQENKQDDQPSLFSLFRKSHIDKLKSVIHHIQLNFFPPNLDFRSADDGQARIGGGGEGGGKMREAVEKSFGTGKVAIQETAKSAANVVGHVMQKTADKVNKDNDESSSEL